MFIFRFVFFLYLHFLNIFYRVVLLHGLERNIFTTAKFKLFINYIYFLLNHRKNMLHVSVLIYYCEPEVRSAPGSN